MARNTEYGATRVTRPRRQPVGAAFGWRSTLRTMHEHEHGEQRFGAAAQAAEWEARYGERDGAMWSGRPNGRLVAEVADLNPGRALDVGCGEGADAIWLARRGWTVTAIDISDVAVCRAREAAELAGATVEWVCGDALQTPFPARSSTSCRCSTRRCPTPPARPWCGVARHGAPWRVAAGRVPRPRRRATRAHIAILPPGRPR